MNENSLFYHFMLTLNYLLTRNIIKPNAIKYIKNDTFLNKIIHRN